MPSKKKKDVSLYIDCSESKTSSVEKELPDYVKFSPTTVTALETPPQPEIDRVGDITQREKALSEVGVTRRKVYGVIKDLLEATRLEKVTYDDGRQEYKSVADHEKRARGVEAALRVFGDSKEGVQVNTQVNTVLDMKGLLKRAKEMVD